MCFIERVKVANNLAKIYLQNNTPVFSLEEVPNNRPSIRSSKTNKNRIRREDFGTFEKEVIVVYF